VNVGSDYEASTNGSRTAEQAAAAAGASSPAGLELVRGRPEVLVGAAFVGGVIAAFLLRRLGH
jgi:alpha-D-ribose 1-methylphosphonate 5-triphosphate diphosphatase PhnM